MNALLSLLLTLELQRMVRAEAIAAGVDPELAECICQAESAWDPLAQGDGGRAVGLWQWHLESWRYMRARMGKNSAVDLRADARASTEAALFAISQGYGGWWATYRGCLP